MSFTLASEEIEANFNKCRALCEKLGDRSPAALALVDGLGTRLALCPASSKKDYHRAIPGGLVEHSLRVLLNAKRIVTTFNWDVPKDSLIISCLFHDLGKVGNLEHDRYIDAEDWRKQKMGEMYQYNYNAVPMLDVPNAGLFLCQHYGLKLTQDETMAILLNDGFVVEANRQYCLKVPPLVWAVQNADYVSTCQEKNNTLGFEGK